MHGADQFQAARVSYSKAASIAKNARQKREYASAAKRMEAKIQTAIDGRMSEAQMLDNKSMGVQRLIALEAQGYNYPHDSAVWRHCYVSKRVKECWEVCLHKSQPPYFR
jgi:hypothetical protein